MYTVTLRFRDQNAPTKIKTEDTLDRAMTEAMRALRNYAALRCVFVDDNDKQERHIFSPTDGYLFTIPMEVVA